MVVRPIGNPWVAVWYLLFSAFKPFSSRSIIRSTSQTLPAHEPPLAFCKAAHRSVSLGTFGSGFKLDAMYTPNHGTGDAAAEKGVSGNTNPAGKDGYDIVLSGAIPGVEGLDIGVGYANQSHHNDTATTADGQDVHEGTAYITYAIGGLKVGAQRGVVDTDATAETQYDNEYIAVSYAVNDRITG